MRRLTRLAITLSTIFTIFGLTSAYSQTATGDPSNQSGQDSSTNPTSQDFVTRAAQSNFAEIKHVAQLLSKQSSTAAAR